MYACEAGQGAGQELVGHVLRCRVHTGLHRFFPAIKRQIGVHTGLKLNPERQLRPGHGQALLKFRQGQGALPHSGLHYT